MSFATDLFSGLTGFRDHLAASVEEAAKPALAAVEGHLGRLAPIVHTNILAAEDEAKAILHELYGSLVAAAKTELGVQDTPAPAPAPAPVAEPAPAAPVTEAPAAADPTAAPSTTEESSAPSSTPSTSSATDTAAL